MANAAEKYRKNHFLGSGWYFPVSFTSGNYEVLTAEYEENINQSIHTIMQTKAGTRTMEPQFGSTLQNFFFRQMDETLKGEIIDAVKFALLNNEPRISVNQVTVTYPNQQSDVVNVDIAYTFNQTNTRHNYVYPFHINEGTNLKKRS